MNPISPQMQFRDLLASAAPTHSLAAAARKCSEPVQQLSVGIQLASGRGIRSCAAGQRVSGSVLSNFQTGGLAHHIRHRFMAHGMFCEIHEPPFGQWELAAHHPSRAEFGPGPSFVLLALDEHALVERVEHLSSSESWEGAAGSLLKSIEQVLQIQGGSKGLCLPICLSIPFPVTAFRCVRSLRTQSEIQKIWLNLNVSLQDLVARHCGQMLIAEALDPHVGLAAEPRLHHFAGQSLAPLAIQALATHVHQVFLARLRTVHKLVVLDLDNTLWGGVLGDDGPEGIKLGGFYPGKAFSAFQEALLHLKRQGLLLAICSKNDDTLVRETLDSHSEMILRTKDFVDIRANWKPKSENIFDLAQSLGLGLDSVAFFDDSPFERAEVAAALPDVTVIEAGSEPSCYVERLIQSLRVQLIELTEEDGQRTESYQSENLRRREQTASQSYEEYLHSLEMELSADQLMSGDVGRVHQLFQRTNQFNLTGQRPCEAELKKALGDRAHFVLAARAWDKYGSYGLFSALCADICEKSSTAHIMNWVMSCRAFDRGLEEAIFTRLLCILETRNVSKLTAGFKQNARNRRFASILPELGFIQTGDDGEVTLYERDLRPRSSPDWIKLNTKAEEHRR